MPEECRYDYLMMKELRVKKRDNRHFRWIWVSIRKKPILGVNIVKKNTEKESDGSADYLPRFRNPI